MEKKPNLNKQEKQAFREQRSETLKRGLPDMFWDVVDISETGDSFTIDDPKREELIQWVYGNLLDENAVWNKEYSIGNTQYSSLEKTMQRVNRLAMYAGVNSHDKEYIEKVIANSLVLCWVDFLNVQKNVEISPENWNMENLYSKMYQHIAAALLHDVGYLDCLPKNSVLFREALKKSNKETYNSHPTASAHHARKILSWFANKKERINEIIHPQMQELCAHNDYRPIFNGSSGKSFMNKTVRAIGEHGTYQIVEQGSISRSSLSRNLMFADKAHVADRDNLPSYSDSIPQEQSIPDFVQQNLFPQHLHGNPDVSPSIRELYSASHSRITVAAHTEELEINPSQKEMKIILRCDPNAVAKKKRKYYLKKGKYNESGLEKDLETAYKRFTIKLKKIIPDWEVSLKMKLEPKVKNLPGAERKFRNKENKKNS